MPCPPLVGLFVALCSAAHPAPGATYIGRENQLQVRIPRLEGEGASADIDGSLNEPAWAQAAVLTGFSQFAPLDGIPAADSTQVLIWYSPTALYVGIRAFEAHGAVHASLCRSRQDHRRRQRAGAARHVSRPAAGRTVFAVNPFGVQMDGTIVEAGATTGGWTADALRKNRARPESGFRLLIQGTVDGIRLRDRDAHSVQESQVPVC